MVYPTDTVYGLGCDPLNSSAVERLYAAKGRQAKPVPVLCGTLADAEVLVKLSPRARELARQFWPGALTIVAPLAKAVSEQLHQGTRTLGVRVPGSKDCQDLIAACGGILVGTSANRSGTPSARTARDASQQLGSVVDLIVDGGTLHGRESTVVEVLKGEIIVLRKGPVGVTGVMSAE